MKPQHLLCDKCRMSHWCSPDNNAVLPWGSLDAPLHIILDAPGDILAEKLLIWILRKLALGEKEVYIDYTFKCALPRHMKLKVEDARKFYPICWNEHPRLCTQKDVVTVIAGSLGSKLIVGKEMKNIHGRKDPETGAWVIYSFKYLLMNPAECVDTWRVIYTAAVEAGLNPRMIVEIPPFPFPTRKL